MTDRGWQPRRDTSWQSSSQQHRNFPPRDDGYLRRTIRSVDSWRPEDDQREHQREHTDRQREGEHNDERHDWTQGPPQRRRRGDRGRRHTGQTQDGEAWVTARPFPPHADQRGPRDRQPAGDGHRVYTPSPVRTIHDNRSVSPQARRSPQRRGNGGRSRSGSRTSSVRRSRSASRTRSTRAGSRSRSASRSPVEMDTSPFAHETYIPRSADDITPAPSPALHDPPPHPPTQIVHGLPSKPTFRSTYTVPGPRLPPNHLPTPHAVNSPASSSMHQGVHVPPRPIRSQPVVQARANTHDGGGFTQQAPQANNEPEPSLPPPMWLGAEAQRTRRLNKQQQQEQQEQLDVDEQPQTPVQKRPTAEDIYVNTQMQRISRWRRARIEALVAAHVLDLAEAELHGLNVRKALADAELERVAKDEAVVPAY